MTAKLSLDRFIQQAVLQVLRPRFDPPFSESSYGFRPGRRAHDAVCQAQRYVQSGPPPNALRKMKDPLRAITTRSGGRSIAQVVAMLRGYLLGWRAYFRLADTPRVFAELEQWLHHRLRALHVKHWKRGSTVYRELRRRGVSEHVAAMAARFTRNWWRVAGHTALHLALPASYFDQLGVPRLVPR